MPFHFDQLTFSQNLVAFLALGALAVLGALATRAIVNDGLSNGFTPTKVSAGVLTGGITATAGVLAIAALLALLVVLALVAVVLFALAD